MTGLLLDTNVLSELRRARPAPQVTAFIAAHPLTDFHVSIVTFAEIRFGIELLENLQRRAELTDWLTHTVRPLFQNRVLPISEDVMLRWRLSMEVGRKAGHTFSQPDLIIAATAVQHGLTVVTRDADEFIRAGARVINPWTAPPPNPAGSVRGSPG